MKKSILSFSFFVLLALFFQSNLQAYLGPQPTLGITGPMTVCGGSTQTYCVDELFTGWQGVTIVWTIIGGTEVTTGSSNVATTSNECIDISWGNVTGSINVKIVRGFTDFRSIPVEGILHEFNAFITLISGATHISGPSSVCKFSGFNTIYEIRPYGSASSATWTISPTTNVSIFGNADDAFVSFTPGAQAGTSYTITATGTNGCDGSSFTLTKTITLTQCRQGNITQEEVAGDLQVYPNPVQKGEVVRVKHQWITQNAPIKIVDIQGKTMLSHSAVGESTQFETLNLNPGVYFVVLDQEEGVLTRKLIIQ